MAKVVTVSLTITYLCIGWLTGALLNVLILGCRLVVHLIVHFPIPDWLPPHHLNLKLT